MSGWSPDHAIAMERRHILEGEKRVVHQQALVDELIGRGLGHLMPSANEVLTILRDSLGLSRERLRDLENRYRKAPGRDQDTT
jgi:hypothetical protein